MRSAIREPAHVVVTCLRIPPPKVRVEHQTRRTGMITRRIGMATIILIALQLLSAPTRAQAPETPRLQISTLPIVGQVPIDAAQKLGYFVGSPVIGLAGVIRLGAA